MTYYVSNDGECFDLNHAPTDAGWRKVSVAEGKAAQRAHAIKQLRDMLPAGSAVGTVLSRVGRSGMSRSIKVYAPSPNGLGEDVSWAVARAVGQPFDGRNGGVKVGGCGMDMGFHLVYSLSRALFPDGHACAGKGKCHSNDHMNGDRDYLPSTVHSDGGYALKQRWL